MLSTATAQVKTPTELYPALFKAVQMNVVYTDGKTFPDVIPLKSNLVINSAYEAASRKIGFILKDFVHQYFREPAVSPVVFKNDPNQTVQQHIDTLWSVLKRNPDTTKGTSLLPLPFPYIVPGGRFREVYYWDSYFTMLGLQQAKKHQLMRDMVANFAYLLDTYGHIPNGNRSYYLSRSQPPYFALMVELLAANEGEQVLVKYQKELLTEYNYWMKGSNSLWRGKATENSVCLSDGSVLNRYWDDSDSPREESYREDVLAAASSKQKPAEFYRNIRAAAESGWDFSSRWFADGKHLTTIQTVNLIPVDLNCLLYQLERTISNSYRLAGNTKQAHLYKAKAINRKKAILKYCWNDKSNCFTDFNWSSGQLSKQVTIATSYPLFFKIADALQAQKISQVIQNNFLQAGGVATTLVNSGQQWDRPNGWAPLQFITIAGLNNYGKTELAKTIALRWIDHNLLAFKNTGKLLEKYNVELKGSAASAGGGEYPLQDGFGWTNGVLSKLLSDYKK
jgi:alpha,alpha-trehalase